MVIRPAPTAARANGPVGVQFDRDEGRSWTLALWMMEDQQVAADIAVDAIRPRPRPPGRVARDAERLLAEAHRGSPRTRAPAALPDAINYLPDPQQAVVELVLRGRLDVAAAMSSGTPAITRLADALRGDDLPPAA